MNKNQVDKGRDYVRQVWPNAQSIYDEQIKAGLSIREAIEIALEGISYDPSDIKVSWR